MRGGFLLTGSGASGASARPTPNKKGNQKTKNTSTISTIDNRSTTIQILRNKMITAVTKHALALLVVQLSANAVASSFVPSRNRRNSVGAVVASCSLSTRRCRGAIIRTTASRLFLASDDGDAPERMPEIEEIAPTYDTKSTHHFDRYKLDHAKSVSHNAQYWNKRATDLLTWDHYPFDNNNCEGVMTGGFEHGDVTWFAGARMNICYNAIDRHVQDPTKKNQVAMIWEGDEPGQSLKFTYSDLQRKVSEVSGNNTPLLQFALCYKLEALQ
jgi:hypothetical protein